MLGSGDPTPYDFPLLALLALAIVVFVAGAIFGGSWSPGMATGIRRGVAALAVLGIVAVMVLTPTRTGTVGAGRIITIFPAFGLAMIVFAVWSWRAGRI